MVLSSALSAQEEKAPTQGLFTDVQIFNGVDDESTSGSVLVEGNLMVEGNLIKAIGNDVKAGKGATLNAVGGRTLMPDLIEGHGHLQLDGSRLANIENNRNWEELAVRSTAMARYVLMSGFTSWRDAGGMAAGLQKSVNAGVVDGPRIVPSGGFIGPTGSHADFRNLTELNETFNGPQSSGARLSLTICADVVDAIKTPARQNFMQGASQIKIMSPGG